MKHKLKIWPEYFDLINENIKKFEMRKNDRDFKTGDILILEEYEPFEKKYSGRKITRHVDFIMHAYEPFGLMEGFCIMGLK